MNSNISIKYSVKSLLIFISLCLLISSQAFAQKTDFRTIENKAFKVGERLTFDINFGFITAGIAEYSIPKIMKIAGRDVYQILFQVNTVSTFETLYKVRDRYETYVDVKGLFPWRFEQHIREGGYTKDYSAFFDQRKNKAKTTDGTFDVPKYVNDIVSAFYLVRTYDLAKMKTGERISLSNFFDNEVFPLDVVIRGRETISVKAGKFDCIIIEPMVKQGGLFKHEGDIIIWVSNDDLKLPVKVKTKIIIGSIDAELTGYYNLAGELKSKKK